MGAGGGAVRAASGLKAEVGVCSGSAETAQQSRGSHLTAAAKQFRRFALGNLIYDFLNHETSVVYNK